MTDGEKGNRAKTKTVKRHHMAVRLDLMAARDEGIEAKVIALDVLRRLNEDRASAMASLHLLGLTEDEAAKVLGTSLRTLQRRIEETRKAA